MLSCSKRFYTLPKMLRRLWRNLCRGQSALIGLVGGLSYRRNIQIDRRNLDEFKIRFGVDERSSKPTAVRSTAVS
jgi:hypothetical protein